ncbi:MAG: hypothetical protein ACOZIN_10485 [Myxococcota bacterium]
MSKITRRSSPRTTLRTGGGKSSGRAAKPRSKTARRGGGKSGSSLSVGGGKSGGRSPVGSPFYPASVLRRGGGKK